MKIARNITSCEATSFNAICFCFFWRGGKSFRLGHSVVGRPWRSVSHVGPVWTRCYRGMNSRPVRLPSHMRIILKHNQTDFSILGIPPVERLKQLTNLKLTAPLANMREACRDMREGLRLQAVFLLEFVHSMALLIG